MGTTVSLPLGPVATLATRARGDPLVGLNRNHRELSRAEIPTASTAAAKRARATGREDTEVRVPSDTTIERWCYEVWSPEKKTDGNGDHRVTASNKGDRADAIDHGEERGEVEGVRILTTNAMVCSGRAMELRWRRN